MITVAINGFGRIGRNFLRVLMSDLRARETIRVVAINVGKSVEAGMVAHLFKYDTLMGMYPGSVVCTGTALQVDGHVIELITESDPAACPWKRLSIDWVVEASGHFTKKEGAACHLHAGAVHVLITAPALGADITVIPGVNDDAYDATKHQIVSLGSCTSNAVLPMLEVMRGAYTIVTGCMTTVHAYTNTQVLLDVETDDPRRSRAAALNIVPTATGAHDLIGTVIPVLAGRMQTMSLRVPVAKVSLIDLTLMLEQPVTVQEVVKLYEDAATAKFRGIIAVTNEPLVSSDFNSNPHSVIIDTSLTMVGAGNVVKLFGWYDNEWGYCCRLKDFLKCYA